MFDIEIDSDIKTYTYCYLQPLPINEISFQDNVIYLDYNKSVDELSLVEAATIAGLFQAPDAFDPYKYPTKAENRRNIED